MVIFENVSKQYKGSVRGVKNINLAIGDGEMAFLTGATGSGKSTLLRLLLAEFPPDEGDLFVGGENIGKLAKKDIPLYRRNLGVVFQDFRLIRDKTVSENVAIALQVAGIHDYRSHVNAALASVGMADRSDSFPDELSGGEQQRVAIARAIVNNPKVILADEPTGNLDAGTSKEIMALLRGLNDDGRIVVMATHDTSLLGEHDKVISLDSGHVVGDEN